MSEWACDRIEELEAEVEALRVQAAFWKQAAEHAVDGWTKQEDVSLELRDKLVKACDIGLRYWLAPPDGPTLAKLRADALADDAPEGQ